MSFSILYILRKRLPQYNSIEELFYTIISKINNQLKTDICELKYSGGGPTTILKNLKSFNNSNDKPVVHITGDVHYMALVTGKRTILTIHDIGSVLKGNVLKRTYIKWFWFSLPALCVNRITVISEFSKEELKRVIPFAADKIKVIYNPVNSQLTYTPKDFNETCSQILLIGTKANKNLERTFEALKGISCRLTIIGKLTESQKSLLKLYDLKYTNLFQIPYREIVDAYKACDLVLFASTYEGFGMPIIEAQAVGRPVITSNLGAMKEIAGAGAVLVNPFLTEEIKQAVQKIISTRTFRTQLIEAGLKNIERFTLEHITNQYLELYKEVANG